MQLVYQLTAVIEILIRGYPMALKVLTGEAEPPGVLEIAEMLGAFGQEKWIEKLGVRIDDCNISCEQERTYVLAESFLAIIEKAGGWDHVISTIQDYIKHNKTYWDIFRDYLVWVNKIPCTKKRFIYQENILTRKYGYTFRHLRNIRKQVPEDMARVIVCFDTRKFKINSFEKEVNSNEF